MSIAGRFYISVLTIFMFFCYLFICILVFANGVENFAIHMVVATTDAFLYVGWILANQKRMEWDVL